MILKNNPPEGFLNEETICDFLVTTERKKLWAVEIDMVQELLRVCQKYNLKIFMDGGSLMGTMRHQGFIPWDDDIDMVMFREDYDRLCEVAPQEFSYPHFFQNIYTDDHYTHRHAQIRNVETAAWGVKYDRPNQKFCEGIFIDIFVYDGMPKTPRAMDHHYKRVRKAQRNLKLVTKLLKHLPDSLYHWLRDHTTCLSDKAQFRKFEDILRSIPAKDSFFCNQICVRRDNTIKFTRNMGEPSWVPFHYIQVPIPQDYDMQLTVQYGDWRTPVRSAAFHGGLKYDCDHSYKELRK